MWTIIGIGVGIGVGVGLIVVLAFGHKALALLAARKTADLTIRQIDENMRAFKVSPPLRAKLHEMAASRVRGVGGAQFAQDMQSMFAQDAIFLYYCENLYGLQFVLDEMAVDAADAEAARASLRDVAPRLRLNPATVPVAGDFLTIR